MLSSLLNSIVTRLGQDRICTPYMTVYLMISQPEIPYIHRIYIYIYIYMVLPTLIVTLFPWARQSSVPASSSVLFPVMLCSFWAQKFLQCFPHRAVFEQGNCSLSWAVLLFSIFYFSASQWSVVIFTTGQRPKEEVYIWHQGPYQEPKTSRSTISARRATTASSKAAAGGKRTTAAAAAAALEREWRRLEWAFFKFASSCRWASLLMHAVWFYNWSAAHTHTHTHTK